MTKLMASAVQPGQVKKSHVMQGKINKITICWQTSYKNFYHLKCPWSHITHSPYRLTSSVRRKCHNVGSLAVFYDVVTIRAGEVPDRGKCATSGRLIISKDESGRQRPIRQQYQTDGPALSLLYMHDKCELQTPRAWPHICISDKDDGCQTVLQTCP